MKPEAWDILRTGDYIRSAKRGVMRKILKHTMSSKRQGQVCAITLMKIAHPPWTPGPHTTYVRSDRYMFKPY